MYKTLLVIAVAVCVAAPAAAQATFRCESQDGNFTECRVIGGGNLVLTRQLSDTTCVEGRNWGVRNGRVWVDDGCRAEFSIVPVTTAPSIPLEQMVRCESHDNRTSHCVADTAAGVRLVRQLSDSSCEYGRDWGYDARGVWVTNGCRAEFASRAPMQARLVVCESQNNGREHCRADTSLGIALSRQISDNPCVLGRSWGYDENGIWVDHGCRGEFSAGNLTAMISSSTGATLVCESKDGRRAHCPVNTSGGIRLMRQFSDSDCVFNRTWGYDANGVWVSEGCRGEFAVSSFAPMGATSSRATTLVCESKDGKLNRCPADTRMGVAVMKQLSDSPCELNSTWGYNSDGIWVTAGCRAEFYLRK